MFPTDALFTFLHNFIGKKLSDGKSLGGAGRLTNERANTIQNFYSRAMRDNKKMA